MNTGVECSRSLFFVRVCNGNAVKPPHSCHFTRQVSLSETSTQRVLELKVRRKKRVRACGHGNCISIHECFLNVVFLQPLVVFVAPCCFLLIQLCIFFSVCLRNRLRTTSTPIYPPFCHSGLSTGVSPPPPLPPKAQKN